MADKNKILVGVPPRSHLSLAMDEVDGLKDTGFFCDTVPYGRNADSVNNLNRVFFTIKRAVQVVKKLKSFHPDFLYLNSRFEPAGSTRDYLSLLVIKLFYRRDLKIVIKSHGSNNEFLNSSNPWYKKLVVPYLRKTVDAWIFLSTEEKQSITEIDPVIGKKIAVLPNIVKPERSVYSDNFRLKHQLNDNTLTLLYAGRIVKEKGVLDIINAVPLMKCKDKCKMIFVGEGSYYKELQTKVKELGLSNYVVFTGVLSENECDQFYSNADALVYPTYDSEGFSMAIFKSVAAGMSIITTRIRAAKDYLKEPENTLWVNAKSPASIATAIDNLYNDPALRSNMQTNNVQLGKSFSSAKVSAMLKNSFLSLNKN